MSLEARYIVGIDLGTTNSALAYRRRDAEEEPDRIQIAKIVQLVQPNELAELTLLPSFLYLPAEVDFPRGSLALPWDSNPDSVVGELARRRGSESPARLVSSAKSWLS